MGAGLFAFEGAGTMPRFMVERTFPDGLEIPVNAEGADICLTVVGRSAEPFELPDVRFVPAAPQ